MPQPAKRLSGKATFAALAASRAQARSGPVSCRFVSRDQHVRVGYAIARRHGSAVVRNRIRRRLRALIASRPPEQSGDYLLVCDARAASMSYEILQNHLERAVTGAPQGGAA